MTINYHNVQSPTEIITTKLGIPQFYKQECINEIYKIGDKQNQQTNVKAIMSSYEVWEETDKFKPFISRLFKIVPKLLWKYQDAITNLQYRYTLVNLWSAIYQKGHYTQTHHHIPCRFAFVYYLQTSGDTPLIFNDCNLTINPEDDTLVLFPGDLMHSVGIHRGNKDRICLAGNMDLIHQSQTK